MPRGRENFLAITLFGILPIRELLVIWYRLDILHRLSRSTWHPHSALDSRSISFLCLIPNFNAAFSMVRSLMNLALLMFAFVCSIRRENLDILCVPYSSWLCIPDFRMAQEPYN